MIGIIFDCDGVLVDSEVAHFLSWQETLRKRGIFWQKENHYAMSGYPGSIIAQKFCELFDLKSPELLLEDKRSFFQNLQAKGFNQMQRGGSLLRHLFEKKQDYKITLGIASGARKKEILLNLKHQGILHFFDVIVSGYDDLSDYHDIEGTNKPKPYIYLHAAKLLGIEPRYCAAIEDSGPGILAANLAGMVTFAIPNEFTKGHDFSSATYLLSSEDEIDMEEFLRKLFFSLKRICF
jgi:beta-phosphoglucomutase-like phosphatase (HAD superfamily)